jgi:glycosyltransferase involved in cell wall biosynthesis
LWATLTVNRVRLYQRRHGRLSSAAFTAVVVLNEALRAAVGRPTSRAALRALLSRDPSAPTREAPRPGYICFSAQDWWYFNRAHSDFQLLTRVAQERPVLLVNSLGMRLPLPGRSTQPLRRVARKAGSVVRHLRRPLPETPGFHVLTPLFLPVYGADSRLRRLNAAIVRWQVERAARRAGICDPTIIVTLPSSWDVVAGMSRRKLVFNRSDKHSAFGEADVAWIRSCEEKLLEAADVTVYTSRALLADEGPRARRAEFLDHGVDLDHFARSATDVEPDDLRDIAHPRAGFFGAVDDYIVDLDLLEHLARQLPEVSLVLVGGATCSMRRFESLPNVFWLGQRPYADIPCYGAGFDVALMPWLDNEWIAHSNPIKLKEYLALGLPVVSMRFPEGEHYRRWIRMADNADEFVKLVRTTLQEGGPATPVECRAAVAERSWDRQARALLELCEAPRKDGALTCAAS